MTATEYEALVKFAAEKMGVEAVAIKEKRYFEPTYPPDSTMASSALSYQEVVTGYVVKGTGQPFDLTSPDLFFKGLAVIPPHLLWYLNGDSYHRSIAICNDGQGDMRGKVGKVWWDKPADIPLAFWQAWAEAEGVELK